MPNDVNVLAARIVEKVTPEPAKKKDPNAVALGRKSGKVAESAGRRSYPPNGGSRSRRKPQRLDGPNIKATVNNVGKKSIAIAAREEYILLKNRTEELAMLSKGEAEPILAPRLEALWKVVVSAVERFLALPANIRADFDNTTRANIIGNYVSQEAMKSLVGMPGLEVSYKYRQVRVLIDGKLRVIFKKLNTRFRPSSVSTKRLRAVLNQVDEYLMDLPEPPTSVVVGYQWNVFETGLNGVYAICPELHRNNWMLEITLPDDAADAGMPTPITPNTPPSDDALVRKPTPKKNKAVTKITKANKGE